MVENAFPSGYAPSILCANPPGLSSMMTAHIAESTIGSNTRWNCALVAAVKNSPSTAPGRAPRIARAKTRRSRLI